MPCSIPRWTGFRCSLVGELRVPAPVPSLSVLPSPLPGRVGIHITTFEACSSFTRVTACIVAHPPYVGFIARLHPGRFPGSDARKLPSSTNNLLGWVLPPLVICAVEAHPIAPHLVPNPSQRLDRAQSASNRPALTLSTRWHVSREGSVNARWLTIRQYLSPPKNGMGPENHAHSKTLTVV